MPRHEAHHKSGIHGTPPGVGTPYVEFSDKLLIYLELIMNTYAFNFDNLKADIHKRQASPETSLSGKLALGVAIAFVLMSSFFISIFLILVSMVLIPLAALRLWWFKRKIQQRSVYPHASRPAGDIIDAEYIVVNPKQ